MKGKRVPFENKNLFKNKIKERRIYECAYAQVFCCIVTLMGVYEKTQRIS